VNERAVAAAVGAAANTPEAPRASPLSSPVLVGRAQSGDRQALDTLLRALQAPLFAHIRTIVGDDAAAEDALQETLLRVCRKLGTLREPRWFRAWAYRIATREAIARGQGERRWREWLRDDALAQVPAPEAEARFDPALLAALAPALERVSPASRMVLRMHYLDGLTYGEIAEALGLSPGTVKSRLAYGLQTLRTLLGPLGD
jgi:RNA polymerase sigma-70 factor (ECF subfamily)